MIEAYPLQWPQGKQRTNRPERSRFKSTFAFARDSIVNEIRLLNGILPIISTNIPLRRDGLPYANFKTPEDKGVAVYFTLRGKQMCFSCDRWDSIADNMQAIRKTIEALRGIERWGAGEMVQQAFTGFEALPAPDDYWSELGLLPGASREEIQRAYRGKAKSCGGEESAMYKLNVARDKLLENAA